MKKCESCGGSYDDSTKYCQFCGSKLIEKEATVKESSTENSITSQNLFNQNDISSQNNVFNNEIYNQYTESVQKSSSTATMICGIIAIVCSVINYLGVPFTHLIGIILGIVAIVTSRPGLKVKDKKSVAGFACGILGLILGILSIVLAYVFIAIFYSYT